MGQPIGDMLEAAGLPRRYPAVVDTLDALDELQREACGDVTEETDVREGDARQRNEALARRWGR